ncbi:MAG: SDR family oxidoreductase [Pseudomonadota bacterium]
MKSKTVVCIGGSGGMGRGVAEAALELGADVVVTSRSKSKADQVARELGCRGESIDIYDETSVSDFFTRVGRFTHLMITAGAVGRSSFGETPPGEAERFMQGKVWGTHRCIWHAKDQLEADGSITLITGGYSQIIDDRAGHAHTAFRATEAMAQVAAVSLAPIRCNVLRPGFIDSDLWAEMPDDERVTLRRTEAGRTMIGRIVEPVEFGRFAVALMQTPIVTGAVIPVDAGRHLSVSR